MEFKNKTIFITGAASGIGRTTALAFAKQGSQIVVADINEKGGQKVVEEIEVAGGKGLFIKTNVAKFEQVEAAVKQTVASFGRLDIAINNAGIGGELKRTADMSIETWDKVMAVNASSVFYGLKVQIPQMQEQGGGVIVNVSSIAGLRGLPNSPAYTASKHAVVGLTKTAAMEYARHKIRINAICPVFTVTSLFNPDLMDQASAGLSDKLKKQVPMRRFADPSEIANAILWLCSEKASFVTGQAMPVDGGLTA